MQMVFGNFARAGRHSCRGNERRNCPREQRRACGRFLHLGQPLDAQPHSSMPSSAPVDVPQNLLLIWQLIYAVHSAAAGSDG